MAIFGGLLADRNINGYINKDQFSLGRALLTYLTQELFSIHRFSGFDEFYRNRYHARMREAFSTLPPARLQQAKKELEDLYQFTQQYLHKTYSGQSSIKIKRSLNIEEEAQVTNQILDKKPVIEFETNIILSFADKNWLGSYLKNVLLTMDVPFDQILIHYDALHYPTCTTGDEKEHEIWVLNKDPFGKIQQPIQNFESQNLKRTTRPFYPLGLDDFWSCENPFERPSKVWNDRWVQMMIKLREKLGKFE
ncbi:hypothetical protein [Ammoniphilus resinae]|uniref:Uncharacterized protein n=1 Tax=Ammoniphilus resinae TaxID=861532 RepID=A0ABS4GP54_9BACL|nr:hypothetical protein [Ammoniphilus resinae]MBP1932048.1 hypothetical protein [Ammoniphilus resinae]